MPPKKPSSNDPGNFGIGPEEKAIRDVVLRCYPGRSIAKSIYDADRCLYEASLDNDQSILGWMLHVGRPEPVYVIMDAGYQDISRIPQVVVRAFSTFINALTHFAIRYLEDAPYCFDIVNNGKRYRFSLAFSRPEAETIFKVPGLDNVVQLYSFQEEEFDWIMKPLGGPHQAFSPTDKEKKQVADRVVPAVYRILVSGYKSFETDRPSVVKNGRLSKR